MSFDEGTGSAQRIDTIRSLHIMDSEDEADFDEIAAYASEICAAPISLVTLVDRYRQWAKAAHGTDQRAYTMDESICSHALNHPDFFEIEDTLLDERTSSNPLVTGPQQIRYYGGAVLRIGDTTPVGALCILDTRPRRLSDDKKRLLSILARQVARRMELRRALASQELLAREVDHRVKNSLQMVTSLVRLQRNSTASEETRAALDATAARLSAIAMLHAELHRISARNEVALDRFLADLVKHIGTALPSNIALRTRFARVDVPSEVAASLALALNEAISNAAKHAFPGGRSGTISIYLNLLAGNMAELVVEDDGVGLTGGGNRSGGLGRDIIDASATRIGGEICRQPQDAGLRLTVRFPAPDLHQP